MKDVVNVEVGKRGVRKIENLISKGLLSRDRHGTIHGLIEYLEEIQTPDFITANFDEDFLKALLKTGTIARDPENRIWWLDILVQDLVAGKSIAEIRRDRKKSVKKIQKRRKCLE
jgi:hypothetical protein